MKNKISLVRISALSLLPLLALLASCAKAPVAPPAAAPAEPQPPQSFHVVNSGTELKTLVYGTGPRTVILVHGGPGLPGYMNTLGAELADEFRVVELYQRDAADSRSSGPFTIAAKADDLAAVARKFSENGKPIIIAHSGGSASALELAKAHPEAAARLVLIAPAGLDAATEAAYNKELNTRLPRIVKGWKGKLMLAETSWKAASSDDEKFNAYHRLLDLYWPAYFRDKQKPDSLKFARPNWGAMKDVEADYKRMLKEGSFVRGLSQIKAPVLHLHGTLDPLPYARTKAAFEMQVPSYTFEAVQGGGHFPWLDGAIRAHFISDLKRKLATGASKSFRNSGP